MSKQSVWRSNRESSHLARSTKRRFSIGLLSVVTLAAVTYGPPSLSADRASGEGATAQPNSSSRPIVIGILSARSGTNAHSGTLALRGTELGVAAINAQGGLLGRKLVVKEYDDHSEDAQARQLTERLITQDRVDLLIGPYGNTQSAAAAAVAARHKMVILLPESSVTPASGGGWAYQAITPGEDYQAGIPQLAASNGYRTVAVIGAKIPYSEVCSKKVKENSAAEGLKVVYEASYALDTDLSSIAVAIAHAAPDVVVQCGLYLDSIGLTRALAAANAHPKMLAESVGPVEDTFIKSLGDLAIGVVGTAPWLPISETVGSKDLVKAYKAKYNEAPDYHVAANFGAMQIYAALVKKVGSLDQQKIRDAIKQTPIPTILGTFKINSDGLPVGYSATYFQIDKKGDRVIVAPPNIAKAKLQPYGG